MNLRAVAAISVISFTVSFGVSAQSIDDLLEDHAQLNSELDRCKQMGMASNDDARCKIARAAEQKRFFGGGVGYTPQPIDVFPNHPTINPQPNSQKPTAPSKSGPPNG